MGFRGVSSPGRGGGGPGHAPLGKIYSRGTMPTMKTVGIIGMVRSQLFVSCLERVNNSRYEKEISEVLNLVTNNF